MDIVKFFKGIKDNLGTLPINNPNAFYITTDTGEIHLGEHVWRPNVQSDWNQTNISADDYIKNKPTFSLVVAEI